MRTTIIESTGPFCVSSCLSVSSLVSSSSASFHRSPCFASSSRSSASTSAFSLPILVAVHSKYFNKTVRFYLSEVVCYLCNVSSIFQCICFYQCCILFSLHCEPKKNTKMFLSYLPRNLADSLKNLVCCPE